MDVATIVSGCTSVHMFAVAEDGKVYGWGRNEKGQLGLGHAKDRKCPSLVEALEGKKVVTGATGRNHSLLITDEGEVSAVKLWFCFAIAYGHLTQVYACGDNRSGQCAAPKGEVTVTTPRKVEYGGAPARRVACGAEFSAIVDADGQVLILPEYA